MLWLAAASDDRSDSAHGTASPVRAVVQAQATVRIMSGARIRLDGRPSADAPPPNDGVVHTEGAAQPARLVEFQ